MTERRKCDRDRGQGKFDPVAPRQGGRTYQAVPRSRGRVGQARSRKPHQAIVLGRITIITLRRVLFVFSVATALSVAASTANASDLIDRNAHGVTLKVNAKGEALLTYTAGGKHKHVLAWAAKNAIAPTPPAPRSRSGSTTPAAGASTGATTGRRSRTNAAPTPGRRSRGRWRPARRPTARSGRCRPGSAGCRTTGSRRPESQGAWELRLSHWTGSLPVLQIQTDWAWHQWDHLFGTFTYDNSPVFGFRSTSSGVPLDTFGRNIYVDTYDSAYGQGWKRENSFLTHTRTGVFCYSFNPHSGHPAGKGAPLPRDGRRPGRDARRHVAGRPGRVVRQVAGHRAERADLAARRPPVPRQLTHG